MSYSVKKTFTKAGDFFFSHKEGMSAIDFIAVDIQDYYGRGENYTYIQICKNSWIFDATFVKAWFSPGFVVPIAPDK